MANDKLKTLLTLLSRDQRKVGRAILITGPWGCGKTFFWRNEAVPQLQERQSVYVTAFGAEGAAAFKSRLLTKFLFAIIPSGTASAIAVHWLTRKVRGVFSGRKTNALTTM